MFVAGLLWFAPVPFVHRICASCCDNMVRAHVVLNWSKGFSLAFGAMTARYFPATHLRVYMSIVSVDNDVFSQVLFVCLLLLTQRQRPRASRK